MSPTIEPAQRTRWQTGGFLLYRNGAFLQEKAMSSTISANVDDKTASQLKTIASLENRSVSNAVSSAITVFVGLPKGLRDFLLELNAQDDQETIVKLGREMMAAAARVRLETATADLAAEHRFGKDDPASSEIDMLEEATALTWAVRDRKKEQAPGRRVRLRT
ncbi:hypothetical protein [Rhizobium sp. C4]|uniref:hypothetical protein n=1 Tax=Rhizobium sp. C4 TaxID=1349800 RepID=UPI001E5D0BAC|nr:hypothetical protein [Rhizobium sp. C4]MCD2173827.1 hypothetical protein [Rhizobium sp. C4]